MGTLMNGKYGKMNNETFPNTYVRDKKKGGNPYKRLKITEWRKY